MINEKESNDESRELDKVAAGKGTRSTTPFLPLRYFASHTSVRKQRLLLLVLISLFVVSSTMWISQWRVHAAAFSSTQSGSWGSASTWGGAGVPGAGDSVTINSGHTVTLDTIRSCGDLTINSGGTLDLVNRQLTFLGTNYTNSGTLTNSGVFTNLLFNGVGGAGGSTQHITSVGSYGDRVRLRITNSTTVTLDAATTISMPSSSDVFIDADSKLDLTNLLTFVGSDSFFTKFTTNNSITPGVTGAAGMRTQGNVQIAGGTFSAPLEIVSGITQAKDNFGALMTIDNSGTLQLTSILTLNGNLTINSGGTLDLNNRAFNFQGTNYTNNGTLMNAGVFTNLVFNGVAAAAGTTQHITAGDGAYGDRVRLRITNTTTVTLDAAMTISMPSSSDFLIDPGSVLNLPNRLTFAGSGPGFTSFTNNSVAPGVTGASGMKTQGSVVISAGTFSAPLVVAGGTTQAKDTFGAPITIDNGGTLQLTALLILNGNITINNGGTLDLFNRQLTFQGTNYSNSGTLTNTGVTNTFLFNGVAGAAATTQNITAGAGSYGDKVRLQIGNTTTLTLAAPTTISMPSSSDFWIDAGSVLNLPNLLTFVGNTGGFTNFSNNSTSPGVIGAAGMKTQGNVHITGGTFAAPLEVASGTTQAQNTFSAPITIDSAGILQLTSLLILNDNLTISNGGTLDLNNRQLTFQGSNYTNSGALINSGVFNGFVFNGEDGAASTTQHIIASTGSYGDRVRLQIGNTTTVNLESAATISLPSSSDVVIVSGSKLNLDNLLTFVGSGPSFTSFTNNSVVPGVAGTAGMKTQGNVQITGGTFAAPLEIAAGTTRAQNAFTGSMTVDSGATLELSNTLNSNDLTFNGTVDLNGRSFLFQGTTYSSQNGTLTGGGEFNFNGVNGTAGTTQHVSSGVASFSSNVNERVSNSTTLVLDGDLQISLLTIDVGSTLNITNRTLRISGSATALTINGSIITTGSTVEMNGISPQTIQTNNIIYRSLTTNNPAGVTLSTNTTVNTMLTLMNGVFSIDNHLTMANGSVIRRGNGSLSGTPNFSGNVDVEYFGTNAIATGSELPASVNNLTVDNQNTVTLGVARTVNGTLFLNAGTLSNGGNLTIGNGALIQRDSGMLTSPPTFGTMVNVSYVGSTAVTTGPEIPSSASVLGNLTINKSGGVTLGGSAAVNGTLFLTSGAFSVGSNTLTINSGVTVGSGSLASGPNGTVAYGQSSGGQMVLSANYANLSFSNFNKTLASSGVISISGTFSPGSATGHAITGSTIVFNGGGAQTIPAFNYNNLMSSNTGARSLQPGGSIRIAGTFTPGANAYTVTGSTVEYNGASAQTLPAGFAIYNNLTINNTAGVTGTGVSGLTITGLLRAQAGTFTSASAFNSVQIDSGAGLTLTGNVTVLGNWLNNGTLTPNNHAVTFNGGTGQTIIGNTTFYDFIKSVSFAQTMFFSSTGTQTIAHSLTLKGTAGNLLTLRSSVDGVQWHLRAPATQDVQFVNVKDSNASGGQTVSATNSTDSGNNINWSIVPNESNAVQFTLANYNIAEAAGSVVVTVMRTGDTSASATVQYATSDSAGVQNCNVKNALASSKCDYISAIGTLSFDAHETSKTLAILIIDDSYSEGDETFTISLSEPSGTSLGQPSTATIRIIDNDAADGMNPVDTAQFFANQHYFDFLNRIPDPSGLAFWTNEITMCGSDISCIEVKRINVSAAFYLSIEFQQTGYLVERIYKTAYGDGTGSSSWGQPHQISVPIVRLNEFLPDTQEIGRGVIVGQGDWEQQLQNNKHAFVAAFVQRPRFTAAYPASMTPAAFVDQLNTRAGNCLSQSERDQLVNALTTGAMTRAEVLLAVSEDQTLVTAEFNRAFVLMQYFGYLRRNPDDPQDTDYTGYDFWLTKLNQFNGNFVNAEMVKAFIISGEYRERFGR